MKENPISISIYNFQCYITIFQNYAISIVANLSRRILNIPNLFFLSNKKLFIIPIFFYLLGSKKYNQLD